MDEREKIWFADVPNLGTIIPKWIYVVVAAFALAGILSLVGCATASTQSDPASKSVYRGPPLLLRDSEGNTVKLLNTACPRTNGWLAMSAAEMHWKGKDYEACWVKIGPYVLVPDSNGDWTPIPFEAFAPVVDA